MLARLVALLLLAASPAVAQGYVVTHVRGEVSRAGRAVAPGDRLGPNDALRFGQDDALVVVVSPRGQAVLRSRPAPRRDRRRAAALYVRDLVAPVRDVHHASARTAADDGGFRAPREMREAVGSDVWVVLGPQVLHVPFAITGDRVVVRFGTDGSDERALAVVDGHLVIDRGGLGPACSPAGATAQIVLVPEDGDERPMTDEVRFVCPDPDSVARALLAVWDGTGAAPDDQIPLAAAFLGAAYGPTDARALEAWVGTLPAPGPTDDER